MDVTRQFPVKVDPTVNVYPNVTTGWTKSVASDGYNYADFQFGNDSSYFVRGFIKYNLTSIPNTATINSAIGYIYVFDILVNSHSSNAFRFKNAIDPSVYSGAALFNSASTFYSADQLTNQSIGWKNVSLNSTGLAIIKNAFGNYISLSVDPGGSWHPTSIYKIRNHIGGANGTEKPYLKIDYTVPTGCSGTPAAGTVAVNPISGEVGSTYAVSATGTSSGIGLSFQWQSNTNNAGWVNVGTASSTYAALTGRVAPAGIGSTVQWQLKTTCANGGLNNTSNITTFTTDYCKPTHTNGNAPGGGYGYVGISNVNIGSINNTTGYQNAAPAYNYYSTLSTDIGEGTTYPLKVTYKDDGSPYNPGTIGAWIDWNGDGDFNGANEFIGVQENIGNNAQITFNVNVPTGTTIGTKRLRVRSVFSDEETLTSTDACTTKVYGETEDYNVKVITVVSCDPVVATASKNILCPGENVTLSATTTGTGYSYTWYTNFDNNTNSGQIVNGPSTNPSFDIIPTQSTIYTVVARKTGCTEKSLIVVVVTSAPTAITVDPISAVACSGEIIKMSVTSGGIIPPTILDSNFNSISSVVWTTSSETDPINSNEQISNWGYWDPTDPNFYGNADGTTFVVVDPFYMGPGYKIIASNLISPPLSFGDYSAVTMTYQHHLSNQTGANGILQISEDGGEIWKDLKTYNSSTSSFVNESISLTAYAGKPYVILRFKFSGPYAGSNYWAVDNIKITGVALPSTVTWSPFTGLFTDPLGNTPYDGGSTTTIYAAPTSTGTYTVSAKTAVGCPSTQTIVVTKGNKNWAGTTDVNWNTATNWEANVVPTADYCVNIPNTGQKPIIQVGTNALAKNLTVQPGGNLQIAGNLTVTDFVKNLGTADNLTIQSDGNLIQINPSKIINVGEVTAQRNVTGLRYNPGSNPATNAVDYVYWSSPVLGQKTKNTPGFTDGFSPGTANSNFFYYNESNDRFYETGDLTFRLGRGYAVQAERNRGLTYNHTYEFKGTPNNGDIGFGLAFTNAAHGFNLVGNPYPSNINFEQLHSGNSALIYNTAYFWTNNVYQQYQLGQGYGGNNYAIYNGTGGNSATKAAGGPGNNVEPDGYIKVGQGFIVQAKMAGTLNFKHRYGSSPDLRVANPGTFFQKDALQKNRYWIGLLSPTGLINSQLIGYIEGATDGFEQDYDAEAFGNYSDLFYSIIPTKKLLIQGKSEVFTNQDKVVLGANFFQNGSYTIALDKAEGIFNGSQTIYLKDKQEGIITNLSEGSYTFTATKGDNTGRFEIIYKPEAILATGDVTKDQLIVYKDANDFVVKAESKKITDLEVYDSSGRMIYKMQPNSTKAIINADRLNNGVYVLKVNQSGEITTKKVIK